VDDVSFVYPLYRFCTNMKLSWPMQR
jgi:hypothetical protein